MSGSRSHVHDWPTSPEINCRIVFKTPLNSPDEDVLRRLRLNDALDIQAVVENGRTLIAAIHPEYGLAGVVTAIQAATLLKCLERGFQYQATVTLLRPPSCQVEIRPQQS